MNKNIKEGDLVLVSAEATGLSKPMEAIIDKIETFMKQTLVTVTYTQPNILSGFGGCFVDAHTKLLYQKKICLLYTSPSPRDTERSRMPSSA